MHIEYETAHGRPSRDNMEHSYAWGNFCKWVFYGDWRTPSASYWLVPGTITDEEFAG